MVAVPLVLGGPLGVHSQGVHTGSIGIPVIRAGLMIEVFPINCPLKLPVEGTTSPKTLPYFELKTLIILMKKGLLIDIFSSEFNP